MKQHKAFFSRGFTLLELLLVIVLFATLITLTSVNLLSASSQASINTTVATLFADLHTQQIRAMTGDTGSTGTTTSYGIYFAPTSYTLFQGSAYNAQNESNITIPLSGNVQFTTISLPDAQIVFAKGSGEFANYSNDAHQIILQDLTSNSTKTIQLNRYGIVVAVN